MGVALVDVDFVEQMIVHIVAVGILVRAVESDVFIKVEGLAEREIQTFRLVPVRKVRVKAFHGAPGGKTEGIRRFGFDFVGNDACCELGRLVGVRHDDDIHFE